MNVYIEDSKIFFRSAAKLVSKRMDKGTIINATMSFALAMERALKGIIYDINPLYILIKPEFKNSIAVLYKSNITNRTGEVTSAPDGDVITFRNSLLRAEVVCDFAKNNKSLLFFTSECRDVIAHNELSLLDIRKMEALMQRDFFQVAQQFSVLYGISLRDLLSSQEGKIATLSASLQGTIEGRVDTIIITHRGKWEILKKTRGYAADKDSVTNEIMRTEGKSPCVCPACGNQAIIYAKLEREREGNSGEDVIVGAFLKKFKCLYCKLEIKDYDDLAYLDKKLGLQVIVDAQHRLNI